MASRADSLNAPSAAPAMPLLRRLLSERVLRWVLPVLTFALILLAWEFWVRWQNVPPLYLPAPSRIWQVFGDWNRLKLGTHTWTTLYETLYGFGLGIVIGVPLAILIIYSKLLQNTVYPILVVFQSVPKAAIAPLLLIWMGFGIGPRIVVAFLVAFFPIVVDTATGLNAIEPELRDLTRAMCANPLKAFFKIRFPAALPSFFAGLKVAITLSIIGAVIGEFVQGEEGLGALILAAQAQGNTPLIFAAITLLSLMGICLFAAIQLLERLVCPWYAKERER